MADTCVAAMTEDAANLSDFVAVINGPCFPSTFWISAFANRAATALKI
jgi:hypothetical protein